MTTQLRSLPSVDKVLADPGIQDLIASCSREAVLGLVRGHLEAIRLDIAGGSTAPSLGQIVEAVQATASDLWRPWPRPLINATGVIVHTNLGRAPLSDEAIQVMMEAAVGYSDLEMDVREGKRGSRQSHVGKLLRQLTQAEGAYVVNNNASAVLLGLAALASGREVIVSRGEAIEIGGGFRIPDVLLQSGANLVEVGTTNKTYLSDYERAMTENTGAFLKVHASNFRITGFTHSTGVEELVDLGNRHKIPVLHDLGSGCLLDTAHYGLSHEPTPQESVRAGAGLTFFSGDKLLGGPQCGIVVGKKEFVDRLAKHPLARAMRIDKLSLAALSATLLHYVKGEAVEKIPVWRMIAASEGKLRERAQGWRAEIEGKCDVVKTESAVGGGSLPGETLPTWGLALDATGVVGGAQELAARLRRGAPPVVGRIEGEQVILDPRTVLSGQEESLLKVVRRALAR